MFVELRRRTVAAWMCPSGGGIDTGREDQLVGVLCRRQEPCSEKLHRMK